MRAAVTYLGRKADRWHDGVVECVDGRLRLIADADTAGIPRLGGVVTGGFTDAHVHLQLVDAAQLAASPLGMVADLGGDPRVLAALRDDALHNSGVFAAAVAAGAEFGGANADSPELCPQPGVQIAFTGAFLTPPGGYPSDRAWAPAGSVREIPDADAAATAIAEMKQAGATCLKVASNTTAGPVFTDELFEAIVRIGASHDLSVIAHAEGPGEAQRATRLRARALAHAPFTERLTDEELHRMHGSVAWTSTLAIHENDAYDIAIDNIRRFRARGGTVVYGTDMGNGDTPVGLNEREVQALRDAGIDGLDLWRTLVPQDPALPGSRLLFAPGATPTTADPLQARLLTIADLENAS